MSNYCKQTGGSAAMGLDLASQMEGDKKEEVHKDPIGDLDKMELVEAIDEFSRYLGESSGGDYNWARKFIQKELDKKEYKDKKDRLMELARSYFSFISTNI